MRIIGGEARGRTLLAPRGQTTRPTQDYVRESLFNILQFECPGARVLDLFAGTGALSLEAISRGAQCAVLSDCDHSALSCIRKNIEQVRCADRCRVIPRDYHAAISQLGAEGKNYDLVFLDPPYRMENTGEMIDELEQAGLLAPEVLVVVEHRRGAGPRLGPGFRAADLRHYGDTEITLVRRSEK